MANETDLGKCKGQKPIIGNTPSRCNSQTSCHKFVDLVLMIVALKAGETANTTSMWEPEAGNFVPPLTRLRNDTTAVILAMRDSRRNVTKRRSPNTNNPAGNRGRENFLTDLKLMLCRRIAPTQL